MQISLLLSIISKRLLISWMYILLFHIIYYVRYLYFPLKRVSYIYWYYNMNKHRNVCELRNDVLEQKYYFFNSILIDNMKTS